MPILGDTINQNAVISNGQSLSGPIEIGEKVAVGIGMPSAWTAASLTFQGSYDGSTFQDVYDSTGTELTAQAAANRHICLDTTMFIGLNYIKIRSGTSGTPVNQGADRALTIITR